MLGNVPTVTQLLSITSVTSRFLVLGFSRQGVQGSEKPLSLPLIGVSPDKITSPALWIEPLFWPDIA